MFEQPGPRLFGLPPGVDFAQALVDGLQARTASPIELAQTELYVSTERMARRLRQIFDAGPASLLPQIRLVTNLADPVTRTQLPDPEPALRRRLELTGLVSKLLDAQPDLAPRSALFDLADSLSSLMEEMQGEGVPPEAIANLDVTDQSGHWQRALSFLKIVQHYFDDEGTPDRPAFNRLALQLRLAAWEENPPQHPIIIAGSTGSRGTTAEFMRAVATLPQGALILPGFDFDMTQDVWDRLDEPLSGEDHPQFRFAKLVAQLGCAPDDVAHWTDTPAPAPDRNKLISLALCPAPVTHQWMSQGPKLPDLREATKDMTLVQAPTLRDEALAIALRLRQAAQDGTTAALITPDRMLSRQVTSTLDRWGILPDDSAGVPAQLTPPGRFLRHTAALFTAPLSAEALLTLLKHPLTHAGAGRGQHLQNTRNLELHIRKKAWPFPRPDLISEWAEQSKQLDWANWVITQFCDKNTGETRPLSDWIEDTITLAERISAGSEAEGSGNLWQENAGRKLWDITSELRDEAGYGADLDARDFNDLFGAVIAKGEVRDRDKPHPHILIWGTLEARVMGADLLILAGLNEGSWPEMPGADPWLNRKMRAEAGLLLPERRIGLAAHDFQQAVAGKEVWLTRSLKSDEAETVPSRWINRLTNLMTGLPERSGPEALAEMKQRGTYWLDLAEASETPLPAPLATRPSPAPPIPARPHKLSVTEIKKLVRDPYAIYARHSLRLRPLDPLMRAPDALMRGVLLHEVLEDFVKDSVQNPDQLTLEALNEQARAHIANPDEVPFPTIRQLWLSRMQRVADWFVETEKQRQNAATPAKYEVRGKAQIPELDFTLTGTADRIDIDERGGAHIYDYKTGQAPTAKEQEFFDKQLLLEAAMVTRGGFADIDPRHVERALFISLKPGDPKEVAAPLLDMPPDKVWAEFTALIGSYLSPEQGFTARRALMKDTDFAEYDHLSRFGEWDVTDAAEPEALT
ncbi:double-strand break repair protein AddB [Tropicibacter sp. R15_0]|uniref:double-strand break repair protein AddB n=1 Tax=Tropicibacter sp. R15_0 TaxID=2821101 RepID=UPI001ADAF492|nr:double-strand break repair protein AddB [Tropicibacter sp. R15_0]MBO9463776.1 double-strand break repair protein AddB [Tropicibacter sp. R15_0]